MKILYLALLFLLAQALEVAAVIIGPFTGLDNLIDTAAYVMVVHIDRDVGVQKHDHWSVYDCRVVRVLKGEAPQKATVKLSLCGAIIEWPFSFAVGTDYIVFVNKDSSNGGEYRAPALIGAVMRVSPIGHEKELKGTIREKIEHVIREGRDFWKRVQDQEQAVFSMALGEVKLKNPPPTKK
jgi:hypothetical protein